MSCLGKEPLSCNYCLVCYRINKMNCKIIFATLAVLIGNEFASAQQIPSTTTAAEMWNPWTWFWPYAIASAEAYRDYYAKAQKATNELYQQIYKTNAFPWVTGNWGLPQVNSSGGSGGLNNSTGGSGGSSQNNPTGGSGGQSNTTGGSGGSGSGNQNNPTGGSGGSGQTDPSGGSGGSGSGQTDPSGGSGGSGSGQSDPTGGSGGSGDSTTGSGGSTDAQVQGSV